MTASNSNNANSDNVPENADPLPPPPSPAVPPPRAISPLFVALSQALPNPAPGPAHQVPHVHTFNPFFDHAAAERIPDFIRVRNPFLRDDYQ
ncbi:hypothetical protein PRIPAC_97376 [Pristionchus pacificus]|uniref:Uncharacterized protein n=1 Tax=Pristionchus pacificus TaxID=54126 RepID=A0A2A6CH41_PRIPA|nr:hypothetical protein PRIPAC_97376 [Pristionchus pacificus]|eukprot:PDM77383.1 hypothetical protein PRIPAC_33113 [Pristionchus pacificus]